MLTKENGFELPFHCKFPDANKYAFTFIALFLFLIIIYSNSFQGQFVFDDTPNIVGNNNVHLGSLDWPNIQKTFHGMEIHKISRPFSYFSLALNYYFGGLNVFGYHLVNFIIHYLAAIFLFLFIYNALKLPALREHYGQTNYGIALLATVFWATSPLQVTAVTYIVQRMASMSGLFYIMSMYFYLKGRTAEKTWNQVILWSLCLLSAFFSFGSKENAILLPFSIWLFDLLLIQGATLENLTRNLKIFVPVTLVVVAVSLWYVNIGSILSGSAYDHRPFTLTERLLTQTRIIVFYISLLIYPVDSHLTLIHDIELSTSFLTPWTTLPAIALILGLLALALYLVRQSPFISFAILFYFLNHAVESTFIPLELIYEHRNYIPSMFFFVPAVIAIVHVLDYFSYKKLLQFTVVGVVTFLIFAQGHTVHERNTLFAHPLLLWTDNAIKTSNLSRPWNNLGYEYWKLEQYEEAYECFSRSVAIDRHSNLSNRAFGLYSLGRYYRTVVKGQEDLALNFLSQAMEANPEFWPSYREAVLCLIQKGEMAKAEKKLAVALSQWPNISALHYIHGLLLLKTGEYDRAINEARQTLFLNPNHHEALTVLGEAYRRKGNTRMSTLYWERFIEEHPDNLQGNLTLIELYANQNSNDKLSRIIGNVMILKGSQTWAEFIDAYLNDADPVAYSPHPEDLIRIFRNAFLMSEVCQ